MKIILLFIFFVSSISAQPYYTFTGLKGMEDTAGVTHLFYSTYHQTVGELSYRNDYDIYHYNTSNLIDTVFFQSGSYDHKFLGGNFDIVSDFIFWDNNPSLYISCGGQGSDEAGPFVQRFDDELPNFLPSFGSVDYIEISKQNDSLLYAGGTELFKSVDGGRNWGLIAENTNFLSLSPFDDKTLFISKYGELYKSTDGGISFTDLDLWGYFSSIKYDIDSNHVYLAAGMIIYVSDNNGVSWRAAFSGGNDLHVESDTEVPGLMYIADGKTIYLSINAGKTFNPLYNLEGKIRGLYKKPGTQILYALTKYKLYEINGTNIKIIKDLSFNPDLANLYPLSPGNKWIYEYKADYKDSLVSDTTALFRKEVIGDTVTRNGNRYCIFSGDVQNTSARYYERIDTVKGIIYRYNTETNMDDTLEVLKADLWDRFTSARFGTFATSYLGDSYNDWEYHPSIRFQPNDNKAVRSYNLVYGIGLDDIKYVDDNREVITKLKGAVIDGVVYGDTLMTDVDENEFIEKKYLLAQNYPNPFNPVTTIKYSIKERGNVSLKVYDILGKEVATLVNEDKPAGDYEVTFNGGNLASGVYIYRITSEGFTTSRKLLLLK